MAKPQMGKLFFTTTAKPWMGKICDEHGNCNVPWVMNREFFPSQIPKMIGSTFLIKKWHFSILDAHTGYIFTHICMYENIWSTKQWSRFIFFSYFNFHTISELICKFCVHCGIWCIGNFSCCKFQKWLDPHSY